MRRLKIKDIGEVVSGSTPKTNVDSYWGGEIPWVTPKEISSLKGQYLDDSVEKITLEGFNSCSTTMLPVNSVLFSSRAPIGLVAITKIPVCTNQGFKSIIPNEKIFPLYLYYALKFYAKRLDSLGNGATFRELSKKTFEEFEIPVPEQIDDQIRIAHLLSKNEALISQRKESLRLLDEFLKSTFLKMFGDPVRNDKNWNVSQLKDLSKVRIGPFGSLLHREDYVRNGIPLVNPSHIFEGKILVDPELTVSKLKMTELGAYIMRKGDVVLGRRGEIGRCAVVTEKEDGYLCGTGSIFIRPTKELNPIFLYNVISSASIRKSLENSAKGVTMKNLNSGIIEDLQIPVPPSEIQTHFAQIVEKTETIKEEYTASLMELEALYSSLSQKAFKGELQFKPETKVLPLQTDGKEEDYFKKRKALACYIINQSLDDDKFGDTKFEKLLNLSDQYAIQRNLGQTYYQKVAGPYDNEFTKLFYIQIAAEKLYKRKRNGKQSVFIPDSNHKKTFTAENYFSSDELSRVDKLITYFKKYTYEQPEIISTLYAVWNNRIIRQQQISDEVLKQDFLDWDQKKKKYKDRLDAALTWMRKENIIPNGWGQLIEKPKGKQRKLVVGKKRANSKRAS